MQLLPKMQTLNDPKKGLHDIWSFIGVCDCYRRHIHNSTYSSAPLTDLRKKMNPWQWTANEEASFQEFKKKIPPTYCMGVPRPKGEEILVIDACYVGGGLVSYTSGRSLTPLSCLTARFKLQV